MNIKYNTLLDNSLSKKKKGIIVAACVVVVALLIVVFSYVLNDNLLNDIQNAISQQEYETAENLIDNYCDANPTFLNGYELYEDLYLAQNQPEKAVEKLQYGLSQVNDSDKEVIQQKIDQLIKEYNLKEKVSTEEQTTSIFSETEKPTEDEKHVEKKYKNSCETIDFKTLARNPDKYKGNSYKFTGEVIQVQEGWFDTVDLRINITKDEYGYWKDTIYATIEIPEGEDNILEDDIITFWGTCEGEYTYTSVVGSSVTLPKINIKYYELVE